MGEPGLRVQRDGGVLRITFDKPDRLNALTAEMIEAASDAVEAAASDGTRVIVRPSGTEPKLKCYLEVVAPVAGRAGLPAARVEAQERLGRIRAELEAALGL